MKRLLTLAALIATLGLPPATAWEREAFKAIKEMASEQAKAAKEQAEKERAAKEQAAKERAAKEQAERERAEQAQAERAEQEQREWEEREEQAEQAPAKQESYGERLRRQLEEARREQQEREEQRERERAARERAERERAEREWAERARAGRELEERWERERPKREARVLEERDKKLGLLHDIKGAFNREECEIISTTFEELNQQRASEYALYWDLLDGGERQEAQLREQRKIHKKACGAFVDGCSARDLAGMALARADSAWDEMGMLTIQAEEQGCLSDELLLEGNRLYEEIGGTRHCWGDKEGCALRKWAYLECRLEMEEEMEEAGRTEVGKVFYCQNQI